MGLNGMAKLKAAIHAGLLIGWAGMTAAQDWIADGIDTATPNGPLQVVPASPLDSAYFRVGDQAFFQSAGFSFVSVIHQRENRYLLLAMPTLGDCGAIYIWLEADAPSAKTFGNCERAFQFGLDSPTPVIALPRSDGDGFDGFAYDGMRVTEFDLGDSPSGVGADPMDWEGLPVADFLRAPEWQRTFLQVLPIQTYLEIADWASWQTVTSEMVLQVDGDWLQATWCIDAGCGATFTGVFLHKTGEGLIVIKDGGPAFGGDLWGDAAGHAVPQQAARFMQNP